MIHNQICPVCQQINTPTATRCTQCGFSFQGQSVLDRSTLGMKTSPDSPTDHATDCVPYLTSLSHRAILFLVHGQQEPVLFENAPNIIIGRQNDEGEQNFFDMSPFGEVALGISRRHAKITYQQGQFVIEDMGSTNGTWLNRQRLSVGKPFPLTCGDVLHVGPVLKLVVCFLTPADEEVVRFALQPTAPLTMTSSSIGFLATHIMAYLTAVDSIQAILQQYQGVPPQPISLVNLSLQDGNYLIELADAAAAIHLLQSVTTSWSTTQIHQLHLDDPADRHPTLTNLLANWLEKLTNTPPIDQYPFIEKLATALAQVAAIPVRLSVKVEGLNDHSGPLYDEW